MRFKAIGHVATGVVGAGAQVVSGVAGAGANVVGSVIGTGAHVASSIGSSVLQAPMQVVGGLLGGLTGSGGGFSFTTILIIGLGAYILLPMIMPGRR
jgi:hypothetical protein